LHTHNIYKPPSEVIKPQNTTRRALGPAKKFVKVTTKGDFEGRKGGTRENGQEEGSKRLWQPDPPGRTGEDQFQVKSKARLTQPRPEVNHEPKKFWTQRINKGVRRAKQGSERDRTRT